MVETQTQEQQPQYDQDTLLEVKNLKMYFPVTSGIIFQRTIAEVKAVDDVTFTIKKGETLGLVGESGCGKTTTGRCILQLYKSTGGEIIFEGQNLNNLDNRSMREMRKNFEENGHSFPPAFLKAEEAEMLRREILCRSYQGRRREAVAAWKRAVRVGGWGGCGTRTS